MERAALNQRRALRLTRPSWRATSATLQSRSNQIRNNSGTGAAVGTPGTVPTNVTIGAIGTLTGSVTGVSTHNGIDYWGYRISGTTSTTSHNINLDGAPIIAASNGQTWTLSVFLAASGGGFTNITGVAVRMAIHDVGTAYLGENGAPSVINTLPSSLSTRQTTTGTIANASTAFISPYLQFTFASGVAIDITLRIGWPMLHVGAVALSPMRTSSAARTGVHSSVTGRV